MEIKVAIQGVRGAFHQEAAELFFGRKVVIHECLTFPELIESVENNAADYGIMAVENFLVGSIFPNYALIRESSLHIAGEVYMRISQNLLAHPESDLSRITEVHSHPMAILQCMEFFRKYPRIKLVESADTALSAKEIASANKKEVGAIGSKLAAKLYGLKVIAHSIETNPQNYTRFLILHPHKLAVNGKIPVQASVAFVVPHVPGSLAKILNPLAEDGVNLTMLQSLPLVGGRWEYIFHADMVFPDAETAEKTLNRHAHLFDKVWIMGIYPAGDNHSFRDERDEN